MKKIVGFSMDSKLHDELKIMAVKMKVNLGELMESLLRKAIGKDLK